MLQKYGQNLNKSEAVELPKLSFGTASVAGLYDDVEEHDAINALRTVLQVSGRQGYFDSALHYGAGKALKLMGVALGKNPEKHVISFKTGRLLVPVANGEVKDASGFKNGGKFDRIFDYSYEGTMKAFEQSMQFINEGRREAGLDPIKLGQVPTILFAHDPGVAEHGKAQPVIMKQVLEESYAAFEKLKERGWIQAFGIGTNEVSPAISALKDPRTKVILLAGHATLLSNEASSAPEIIKKNSAGVVAFMKEAQKRDVKIVVGGPANSGLGYYEGQGVPYYNYVKAPDDVIAFRNEVAGVCKKHSVPMAAALMQFPLLMGATSVLSGARSEKEVLEADKAMKFPIPKSFWKELQTCGLLNAELNVHEDKNVAIRSRF